MTELKVIRAVDRVELLKQGRWSFRQPKKQRTSGGITKTHWDYLMDEMVSHSETVELPILNLCILEMDAYRFQRGA